MILGTIEGKKSVTFGPAREASRSIAKNLNVWADRRHARHDGRMTLQKHSGDAQTTNQDRGQRLSWAYIRGYDSLPAAVVAIAHRPGRLHHDTRIKHDAYLIARPRPDSGNVSC